MKSAGASQRRPGKEKPRANRGPRSEGTGALSRWWAVGLAGALLMGVPGTVGCDSPATIEQVCDHAAEKSCTVWSGTARCRSDGEAIGQRVDEAGGCDGKFKEFLACHRDESGCDWEAICKREREELEACIGEL